MAMAHSVDREFVERAEGVLLLSLLGGALAACAIGAMVFEIAYLLGSL
jgi:hypothetical protein